VNALWNTDRMRSAAIGENLIQIRIEATIGMALSHWQIEHITNLPARRAHAALTTSRHVCAADARKAQSVLAEVRWR
jgi:hypothetical protein